MNQAKSNMNNRQNNEINEEYEIVKRVIAGADHEFDLIQKKYRRVISTIIGRMITNQDDVEDLTQETFIKVYRSLKMYKPQYSFSSWIYKIASNNCIDFLRKKRLGAISIDQPLNSGEDLYLEIEDRDADADSDLLENEKKQTIRDAIDSLPDAYREIIILRHEEELDYKEISEKLDMPLGTVKAHLFRARKALLEELKSKAHLFRE